MASTQEVFGLIAKRMRRPCQVAASSAAIPDMPSITDLIRRIDHALIERRAD